MKSIRPSSLVIGIAAFLVAHLVEMSSWAAFNGAADAADPWFLNANRAVLFTMACLAIGGFVAARRVSRGEAVTRGLNVAAGGVLVMLIVLAWSGGGSIFPVVIATGIGVVVIGSLIGALIAASMGQS
jgi:hypothetical protein